MRECAGITLAAETQRGPAGIIFALDNSGSMDEEAAFVQQNMNAFSDQIVAAAVDTRVVVISSYPGTGNGICLDAPLGSGGCPNDDTQLPTFLHVDQEVDRALAFAATCSPASTSSSAAPPSKWCASL